MKLSNLLPNALALAIGGIVSVPAAVHAQDEDSLLFLEEVVVTAKRREASLEDTPIAVSALDQNLLKDAGATDLLSIQTLVPSLTMEQNKGPGFATFRIRGVGNLGNIPSFEPAVGLFVDGAYRSKSGIGVGDLVDVERVEVLRGPQSTLYGRNVTAGLISVYTQRPTEDFEGFIEASLGNYDDTVIKASVSGPLADNVQGRLSAIKHERDGTFEDIYLDDEANENDSSAIRGQLAFQPNDKLSILAIAGYSEKDMTCCNSDVQMGALGTALSTAVTGTAPDADLTNRKVQYSQPNTFEGETKELIITVEYEFDNAVLSSTTAYDDYEIGGILDAEQSPVDALIFIDNQEAETFSQEFRLTSNGDGDIDWMTGINYYKNNFTRGSLDPSKPTTVVGPDIVLAAFQAGLGGTPGDTSSFRSIYNTENIGVFAQADWYVTDRISIGAGIRWFTEDKELEIDSTTNLIVPGFSYALITTVPAPVVGDRDTDQVVWNLSAQIQATEETMVYASASRGAKGGGFNADWDALGELTLSDREFDDEIVMNYEVGAKTSFMDRRITLNANLFYSDFKDFQNASFKGLSFVVANADQVVTQGLELDAVAAVTTWLTADFSYTYLDAEYKSFTNGPCYFPNTGNCDLSGETLPLAPENRLHLGLQGTWDWFDGDLYTRVDYNWTDETETENGLNPKGTQDAYGIVNGRIGWRNEQLDINAWIQNATDEEVITGSASQTTYGEVDGSFQAFLNDPQTYGVSVRYSF
jgi:iron complex outermembrane recepter protein